MKTNIYALIHPDTKEVIYIGQTKDELTKRLNGHYWKLNEVKRGERNWTKLFHFLDNLLPNKVEIILLKEVVPANGFNLSNFYEKFYIDKYRKINPNLLNEADGGIGGAAVGCGAGKNVDVAEVHRRSRNGALLFQGRGEEGRV